MSDASIDRKEVVQTLIKNIVLRNGNKKTCHYTHLLFDTKQIWRHNSL